MRRKELHETLCLGLENIIKHKSTGLFQSTLNKLPEGKTKRRVQMWILVYGRVEPKEEDPSIFRISKNNNHPTVEEARSFPYWKFHIPETAAAKTGIKADINQELKNFYKDPSDMSLNNIIQLLYFYQKHSNFSSKQKHAKPAQNNLVQGGAPGLKG